MTKKELKRYRFLIAEICECKDEKRKDYLEEQVQDILSWIYSIDDAFAQRVFIERYVSNRGDNKYFPPGWIEISNRLNCSESTVKHVHSKFLSL